MTTYAFVFSFVVHRLECIYVDSKKTIIDMLLRLIVFNILEIIFVFIYE